MAGNRPDGIPNGVKMILKGNKSITMCAECLIDLGQMTEAEKDAFFRDLQERNEVQ